MPILRAGPFASSSDSFIDEPAFPPSALPFGGGIIPVNCANHSGSSNWPWRYLEVNPDGSSYESATLNASSVTVAYSGPSEAYGLAWRYQAAESITLTGSYSISFEAQQGAFAQFQIFIDFSEEIYEDSLFDGNGGTLVGSFSVTLPSAVVPRQIIAFASSDSGGSAASMTVNISS